ncbi:MAG TPA: hypothetical protein VFJ85_01075 [Acidimicrobiales bacterium]|nr:hypothetical protein [Acidimicrobiales bacterium]
MGGGKTKAHESFVVSPAPAVGTETPGTDDGVPGPSTAMLDALGPLEDPDATPADKLAALKAAAGIAGDEADQAALKAASGQFLGGLDADQLAGLALAEGFEHPTLVGLNAAGGGPHPLAHWLDPAYPPTSPSKLAIQAKASERFAALADGATIAGVTLADVQAAEAAAGAGAPPSGGGWVATPADIVTASTALHQALADFNILQATNPALDNPNDGGLGALLAAENHLATAQCAELGSDLDAAKASVKALVDKSLAGATGYRQQWAVDQVVAAAHAEGILSEAEAKNLNRTEQLALLRSSTAATERAALGEVAAARAGELAAFVEAKGAYAAYGALPVAGGLELAGLDSQLGKDGAVAFATAAGNYFDQRAKVMSWSTNAAGSVEFSALTGYSWAPGQSELTSTFRTWAKGQKLADLRAVATSLGMPAAGASRAQIQNYIAASWDPTLDKSAIAAAVAAKAAKPAGPAKVVAPKPVVPVAAGPAPPAAPVSSGPPSARSFAAKHLQIVEALKAHQALAADLPARPPAETVATWAFGPAQAAHLGGAHAKSLHAAPDGSTWMFKPDKTAGGARAHAEAQASAIFARVGVPSVPVYARSIAGKVGSVQPLVHGATSLSADPKGWSQTDVDNLVRYHVAAWAVGDHDGNPANVIRTPSGGLCPVDQGQAFKFFGRDRLAADYHPNDSFGSVPAFHQAYAAAKAGGLAKGVAVRPEAALPTIKAFEALPDAAYRALLASVATEGVAHGVHWVAPMRKAAAKRLGTASVSDAEVAEEFLRTAVARKNGLRAAFAGFFTASGFGAGAKLEKVA